MLYSVLSGDEYLGDTLMIVADLVIDVAKIGLAQYNALKAAKQEYDLSTDAVVKQMAYNQLLQIATEAGALKSASSSEKTKKILVYSGVALVAVLLSFFLTTR
jgi:hypothetical protein